MKIISFPINDAEDRAELAKILTKHEYNIEVYDCEVNVEVDDCDVRNNTATQCESCLFYINDGSEAGKCKLTGAFQDKKDWCLAGIIKKRKEINNVNNT